MLRAAYLLRYCQEISRYSVLSPGPLVCVARGGYLTSELANGNHLSVVWHPTVMHDKVCKDVIHGRALRLAFSCRHSGA